MKIYIHLFFLIIGAYNFPLISSHNILSSTIENSACAYTRPMTVLEIGKSNNPMTFSLAKKFPHSIFVLNSPVAPEKLPLSSNTVIISKPMSLQDIQILGECEHFDIVIIRNFSNNFHAFGLQEALGSILLLGEKIFIEDSYYTDPDVVDRLKLFSKNITQKKHSTVYEIERVKTKLQRRSWIFPFPPDTIAAYSIISNYHEKYLAKPRGTGILKTQWEPGINLVTFKMLEGSYPTRETVITAIKELVYTIHSDCQAHNLIVQGTTICPIDTHDPYQPEGQYSCDKAIDHLIEFITSDTPRTILERNNDNSEYFFNENNTSKWEYSLETKKPLIANDNQALEYLEKHPDAYVALSFPCIKVDELIIEKFLTDDGAILYKKYLELKNQGSVNLIRECYKHDGHSLEHLQALHDIIFPQNGGQLIIYVYTCRDLETLRAVKDKIRAFFKIKCAIHATDSHEQSIELGRYLFTANGIHFLLNRNLKNVLNYPTFNTLFHRYKQGIRHDSKAFVVDGSATLSAYGLRDCNDIDYLSAPNAQFIGDSSYIGNHNSELEYHHKELLELLYNQKNFFYFEGVKFISLQQLYTMKQHRYKAQENPKDLRDIALIESLL